MPLPRRIAPAGCILHVLNRANGRGRLFETDACYRDFLSIFLDAQERDSMRVLAYCLMPNHWHFLLWPRNDGDISRFMHRLTLHHTKRWHERHGTTGHGHLYQGRFKSFPVCNDAYLWTVCRYIEANPLRAGLVLRARDWPWSSARDRLCADQWRGLAPSNRLNIPLEPFPLPLPVDWNDRLDALQADAELDRVRHSVRHSVPYGDKEWSLRIAPPAKPAAKHRGRPGKSGSATDAPRASGR